MRISALFGILVLAALVAIALPARRAANGADSTMTPQDTMYLDRRISALEQRINYIESSVRNLEQQALLSRQSSTAQQSRDPEISLIRSELEILKGRVRVAECGLIHLDERTLSPSAKASRHLSPQQANDPCRLKPESPLQLTPQ